MLKQEYWMPCGFWRAGFFAVIFILGLNVQGAPHRGDVFELKQPDGSRVSVHVWGDEYYQRVESIDGYSLIRNAYGWICYAELSQDGSEFMATDIVYEGIPLDQMPLIRQYLHENRGLKKGLKINSASRSQKALKNRERLAGRNIAEQYLSPGQAAEIEAAESAAASAPLLGSIVGLTILIDFADEPADISVAEVNNYCNQVGYAGYSNNGSVRDYFYDVSNGLVTYTNIVVGYYRAAHNKSYYDTDTRPYGEAAVELLSEALNWLEGQSFDFTQLSRDDSNRILATNLFYAGYPDSGWAEGLWPHASGYYGFTSASGVKSGRYQITNAGDSLRLGTFCHENGHMICGYPDLYDYGYESNGAGDFCLMAYGGSSTNPVPPNPYFRDLKGWETIIGINNDPPGTIRNHQANGFTTYRYSHPINTKEFFLIESRLQTGRNASIPDEGLLIWHIDEDGSNNNEQMTPDLHYRVSVEQADGLFQLEAGTSYGGSGDLFHAGYKDAFDDTTLPDAKWWDGSNSGLAISNISGPLEVITFVVNAQETYPPVAAPITLNLTGIDTVSIELLATDDGLPGPLSYIITSLPAHGRLFDGDIEIAAVPYTLQNDLHTVDYEPCPYFGGTDQFSYKANDGGTPPDGGDSNIAEVTLVAPTYDGAIHETAGLSSDYPFYTTVQDVRMQTIYHAAEMGTAKSITALEFHFYENDVPPPVLNFTIRMQHTEMDRYPASADFINDNWTTVYRDTYTAAGGGWQRIDFQSPFYFDGTHNVLLDVSYDNVNYSTIRARIYAFDTGDPNRVIYQKSRNLYGDPLFWTVSMFGGTYFTSDRAPALKLHGGPAAVPLASDFDVNCSVGLEDLLALAGVWMSQQGDGIYDAMYDISDPTDQTINLPDFAVLALEWMTGPFDAVYLSGDFDESGIVDGVDLAVLMNAWLSQQGQPGYNASCDISEVKDQKIDMADWAVFAAQWMMTL